MNVEWSKLYISRCFNLPVELWKKKKINSFFFSFLSTRKETRDRFVGFLSFLSTDKAYVCVDNQWQTPQEQTLEQYSGIMLSGFMFL